MSEELKQAISALQCAKRGHCDHAMADEAIAALERALTQRPAAQAGELEAFESRVTLNSIIKQYRIKTEDAHWLRASLPTQPAAQDEREADEVFLPRRLAATQKLTQLGYRYDSAHGKWLPAPQQAAPEPVGEVFQFHPMPEGWPARFRCESCDGNGEIGELVSAGHFQPPERQTCPDCGGRGWTSEEHAFNADHMREFAEAHALLTRPAPGVPEDVQRDAERLDWLTFNISGKALRDIGVMWGEHANARAAIDAAMLAAAQAKGWQ